MVLNGAMLEAWYTSMVKLKHAFAGITPPEPIPLPDVTTIDGLLEGIVSASKEARVEAAIMKGYENSTVETAYSYLLPEKMWKWVGVNEIGGHTIAWNQLVDTGTTSVTLIQDHKYYTNIGGTESIQTGAGTAISVTGGTDIVCLPNRLVIEFLGDQEVDAAIG